MKNATGTEGRGPSMLAAGVPFYSMTPPVDLHLLGGQRAKQWESMRGWWERFEPGRAIYALPEKVVAALGSRDYTPRGPECGILISNGIG